MEQRWQVLQAVVAAVRPMTMQQVFGR